MRAAPKRCLTCGGPKDPGRGHRRCAPCRAEWLYERNRRKPCLSCGGPKDSGRGHRRCEPCREKWLYERNRRNVGVRGLRLLPRYGITIAEYDAMAEAQDGVCAICKSDPPTSRILKLAVDHDHTTGEIRGLVCQRCNMALHFIENTSWRSAAEAYLADPPARRCAPVLSPEAV